MVLSDPPALDASCFDEMTVPFIVCVDAKALILRDVWRFTCFRIQQNKESKGNPCRIPLVIST
jgi:hypothetical protein